MVSDFISEEVGSVIVEAAEDGDLVSSFDSRVF